MSRRKTAVKRTMLPDARYDSQTVSQVHQRPDDPGQEVHRRRHLLQRHGHRRSEDQPAGRDRLQAGAQQPQAGRGSEEPPRRWCHVSGAGRSASGSSHGAGHALAHHRTRATATKRPCTRSWPPKCSPPARAKATRSRRKKTRTAWPKPTRRSRTIAGRLCCSLLQQQSAPEQCSGALCLSSCHALCRRYATDAPPSADITAPYTVAPTATPHAAR